MTDCLKPCCCYNNNPTIKNCCYSKYKQYHAVNFNTVTFVFFAYTSMLAEYVSKQSFVFDLKHSLYKDQMKENV